jgi:Spy/CpxP family protein refolding chaperone
MRWKAIAAALVLFVAGVLSGAMGQRLLQNRTAEIGEAPPRRGPGDPPAPWTRQRMSFIERMTKDLDLMPDQATEIDRLMKESQERMRELWETIGPKAQEEMTRSREAIRAVLTEEQRDKMDEIFKRHGSGRRGGGGFKRDRDAPDGRPDGGGRGPGGWRGGGEDGRRPPPPDEGPAGPPPEAPPVGVLAE